MKKKKTGNNYCKKKTLKTIIIDKDPFDEEIISSVPRFIAGFVVRRPIWVEIFFLENK